MTTQSYLRSSVKKVKEEDLKTFEKTFWEFVVESRSRV